MRYKDLILSLSVLMLGACGSRGAVTPGSAPPQVARDETSQTSPGVVELAPLPEKGEGGEFGVEEKKEEKSVERVAKMPPECDGVSPCEPPSDFAVALCKARYPGVAVAMFQKKSPWQRLYLKVKSLEAVNVYGSRASSEPLVYGEEVLVLRSEAKEGDGGMQVSGSGDVDLLRWDGSCVTARREMFAEYMMPELHNAQIHLRSLDAPIKEVLLQQRYVKMNYVRKREACRGSRVSDPTPACARATNKLNDAITVAVRGGLAIPSPELLPAWAVVVSSDADEASQAPLE